MPQFSIHSSFPGPVVLVLAVAALVLVAWAYRCLVRLRSWREWVPLIVLRGTAIGIVLLALWRPVLSFQRRLAEHPILVFLVDDSASMRIADDANGRTRLE